MFSCHFLRQHQHLRLSRHQRLQQLLLQLQLRHRLMVCTNAGVIFVVTISVMAVLTQVCVSWDIAALTVSPVFVVAFVMTPRRQGQIPRSTPKITRPTNRRQRAVAAYVLLQPTC